MNLDVENNANMVRHVWQSMWDYDSEGVNI